MAGDGPLLDALRGPADAAGVTLLGRIDDVPSLLARSDVMVMTSVPEGEGMPGVLIEGGLAGLAVVTTRVPGAAEVVVDGDTGFVVPVDDLRALVDACSTLVREPEVRERFGAAARARCEREFSLEASIGKWRELLSSIDTASCTSST
jgi:glycosyltransferase involved in cell wall biosynthesis